MRYELPAKRAARTALRGHAFGREAAIVGEVRASGDGILAHDIGGTRVLDMLVGDPLPRIC